MHFDWLYLAAEKPGLIKMAQTIRKSTATDSRQFCAEC